VAGAEATGVGVATVVDATGEGVVDELQAATSRAPTLRTLIRRFTTDAPP
jgi:hypothetical protein